MDDGIEAGFFADIRGAPQWITLRGESSRNPPLMILSGPGVAMSRAAPFFAPWERAFTLVQWDQPGAGATYARNGELALSFDRLADDAIAVAETALRRLGQDRLVLLGISGGSVVGLHVARRRPVLLSAFVGTGQFVHWGRQEQLGYAAALAAARARRDSEAVAALERIGAPPYADPVADAVKSMYVGAPTTAEQAAFAEFAAAGEPPAGARYVPAGLALPDQRERGFAAYTALRPELTAFDAWALGPRFETPMLFLQGDQDLYSVTSEVERYVADLDAPAKALRLIAGGGHSAFLLREPFLAALPDEIAPFTSRSRRG